MDAKGILYIAATTFLFLAFMAIVARVYRRGNKDNAEAPKYRILDDEHPADTDEESQ